MHDDNAHVYNKSQQVCAYSKIDHFIKECHRLKYDGLILEDLFSRNVGLSTVDGRIVIYDSQVIINKEDIY
jgi:hypothetical protein